MRDCSPDGWPDDMEERRLEEIEKYITTHPDSIQSFGPYEQQLIARLQARKLGAGTPPKIERPKIKKGGAPVVVEPVRKSRSRLIGMHWSEDLTLQLLEVMKGYVKYRGGRRPIGTDPHKWKLVATELPNPYKIELSKYGRSCMVRFDNIRRTMRGCGSKNGRVPDSIRRVVHEYLQLVGTPLNSPKHLHSRELPGEAPEILDIKPAEFYDIKPILLYDGNGSMKYTSTQTSYLSESWTRKPGDLVLVPASPSLLQPALPLRSAQRQKQSL